MEENKKKNKKIRNVIILILVMILCIGIGIGIAYFLINKENIDSEESNNDNEEIILNSQLGQLSEKSFNNMKSNNEDLEDIQKEIIEYFDNDYFEINSAEALKKYPQVFKETKITISQAEVEKIIKSTDEEYEALIVGGFGYEIATKPENTKYIIKGKQLEERLIEGENIQIYGRYLDMNTYQIDGTSYTLPTIEIIDISRGSRFDLSTITDIAKYIFGNDIKITEPDDSEIGIDDDMMYDYYKVTLDNQSNVNFKSFKMDKNIGNIVYNKKENNLSDNVSKTLRVSSDFEHFIVETSDSKLNKYYIDYFDKSFNKLWSREFDCKLTTSAISTMDYTNEKMSIVIGNDLYLIDLETGENIIEPVIVGTKLKVNMFDDGILLVGNENKDTIMKVDFNGNILYRIDADTSMDIDDIYTQIVNDKLIVRMVGSIQSESIENTQYVEKYIVLNNDGTIEYSTNEISRITY